MKFAITGATGFVGGRLLELALQAGHEITALTRRPRKDRPNVRWVDGSLEDRDALAALVREADAVIHVAGVVTAPDAGAFEAGNVTGTLAILAGATAAGVRRFVHVSSLAAREPSLSLYGASKAKAEELVMRSGLDWAIVRPPAVYGPGDREMLELFKAAKMGLMPMPPAGRLSLIHADDLAGLLLALADRRAPSKLVLEPDDGQPRGYDHREFARMLADAQDRRALSVSVPAPVLRLGARLDRLLRGNKAKLTDDRAAYFCHPDWVSSADKRPPAELWQPRIAAAEGLRSTAQWYCDHGWL